MYKKYVVTEKFGSLEVGNIVDVLHHGTGFDDKTIVEYKNKIFEYDPYNMDIIKATELVSDVIPLINRKPMIFPNIGRGGYSVEPVHDFKSFSYRVYFSNPLFRIKAIVKYGNVKGYMYIKNPGGYDAPDRDKILKEINGLKTSKIDEEIIFYQDVVKIEDKFFAIIDDLAIPLKYNEVDVSVMRGRVVVKSRLSYKGEYTIQEAKSLIRTLEKQKIDLMGREGKIPYQNM